MNESNTVISLDQIKKRQDLSELEKLVQAFDLVTQSVITTSEHEVELALALGDKETAVKERIKAGGVKAARGMFQYCYHEITGSREKLWHE
jgi:hypothetical protein